METKYTYVRKKESKDRLDTIIKVSTLLITVITLSLSIWNYNRDYHRDYARKLYEERQKVFIEYIMACTNLANTPKDSVRTRAFSDYYSTYQKIRSSTFF